MKIPYSIVFLFITFCFIIGCNRQAKSYSEEEKILEPITIIFNKAPKKTIVPGPVFGNSTFYENILYITTSEIDPIYIDPTREVESDTITIAADSEFVEFSHDNIYYERINFMVENGDTITITYKDLKPNIESSKNSFGVKYWDYVSNILDAEKYSERIKFLYPFPFVPFENPESYKADYSKFKKEAGIKMLYSLEKEVRLLDSLNISNNLNPIVYNYLKQNIKAHQFLYQLEYESEDLEPIQNYISQNDSLINYEFFRKLVFEFSIKRFKTELVDVGNGFVHQSPQIIDSILRTNIFQSKVRNYLLKKNYDLLASNFSRKVTVDYYNKLKLSEKDSLLIGLIEDRYLAKYETLYEDKDSIHLLNNVGKIVTLEEILTENKNNIIYIDFWASWCKPCREAMPDSRRLLNDLSDKEVVFIYISIDDNRDNWKKASKKENIIDYKNNYLALNYPTGNFYEKINLKSIPRYLIIDKFGNISHLNAPGPSGEQIFDILMDNIQSN